METRTSQEFCRIIDEEFRREACRCADLERQFQFSSKTTFSILGRCFISGRLSGRSKPIPTLEVAIVLCFMTICGLTLPVAGTALPRIPGYQDVEVALETTRCAVRDIIVDIREIHTSLPPDAKFMPSCVLLRRCSGCCQSDRHRCMPTSIYTTRVEISQQLMSPKTFNYITLNFTHHAECACQSPINPTCVPRVCSESQVWNRDLCRCEERCAPRECGHKQQWNSETCRCQCAQCHPNRVVHSRFLQDEVTCLCACRSAGHGRPRCRKRARFSLSQCTCIAHWAYAHLLLNSRT